MKRWSFNDPYTGKFIAKTFKGPDRALSRNTPKGMVAILGRFDPAADLIDWESGEILIGGTANSATAVQSQAETRAGIGDRVAQLEMLIFELSQRLSIIEKSAAAK